LRALARRKKNFGRLSIRPGLARRLDRNGDRSGRLHPKLTRKPMTIQALASNTTVVSAPRSIARYTVPAARVLFGLVFFVSGLDGFLHFLPQPSSPPGEGAMSFAIALMKSGYMFPLIKGTEVAAGALLLANRFVPLALVLIAPVVVNIFAFHAFLAPSGIVLASVIVVLEVYLAWAHRRAYRSLLVSRATAVQ
jgi:uncharacterized membrane protein YphA (DoxX/SURF4 family)